ncbi:MAG: hypothetical protein AAF078_04815 [Planctomycetota bacterium]
MTTTSLAAADTIYELDSGIVRLSELPDEVFVDRTSDTSLILQGTISPDYTRRTTLVVDSEERWARSGVMFRDLNVRFTTNEPLIHEVHNGDTRVTLDNVDLRGWSAIDDATTQTPEGRFHVRDPIRATTIEIVDSKWSQLHRGPVGAQRVEGSLIQDINADALTHTNEVRDVIVDGMSSRGTGSHDDVYQFYGGKRDVSIDGLTVTNSDGALFRTSAADRGDLQDISIKNVHAPTLKSEWNVTTHGLTLDNIDAGSWAFDVPRDGSPITHTDTNITNARVSKLTTHPDVGGIDTDGFTVTAASSNAVAAVATQPSDIDWSSADLDGNQTLDDADLELFTQRYNAGEFDLSIDLANDGRIDTADVDAFTDAFGVFLTSAELHDPIQLNLAPVVLPEPATAAVAVLMLLGLTATPRR